MNRIKHGAAVGGKTSRIYNIWKDRLERGWTVERAVMTPTITSKRWYYE